MPSTRSRSTDHACGRAEEPRSTVALLAAALLLFASALLDARQSPPVPASPPSAAAACTADSVAVTLSTPAPPRRSDALRSTARRLLVP